MLDSLITSKTRIKLLLKFFMNSGTRSYLRSLADEFGESTNSVRVELNRLSEAGILQMHPEKNTVMYQANKSHPLFQEISNIVRKYVGVDQIVEQVLAKLGRVQAACIVGDYAQGKDAGIIDLILVGEIDQVYLISLISKVEVIIKRKIRYLILSPDEYEIQLKNLSGARILIY